MDHFDGTICQIDGSILTKLTIDIDQIDEIDKEIDQAGQFLP